MKEITTLFLKSKGGEASSHPVAREKGENNHIYSLLINGGGGGEKRDLNSSEERGGKKCHERDVSPRGEGKRGKR